MAARDLLRGRLALRIYVVGLAQMAVVAAGFFILILASRLPGNGPMDAEIRHIVGHVTDSLADPGALQRELWALHEDFRVTVAVVDSAGEVIASSGGVDARALPAECARERSEDAGRPERRCIIRPVRFPDGKEGRVVFTPRRPPPPPSIGTSIVPLVLIVVAVSSLLLARSLTRPLQKLSKTARAFGGGDLAARVGLERKDELGEVSRAFDEMA
jgi:HAMP domain-containing protein